MFDHRVAELKTELLKIPEFREFVTNNDKAIDILIPEFEKHSKKMDVNVLRHNFEQIRQDVQLVHAGEHRL